MIKINNRTIILSAISMFALLNASTSHAALDRFVKIHPSISIPESSQVVSGQAQKHVLDFVIESGITEAKIEKIVLQTGENIQDENIEGLTIKRQGVSESIYKTLDTNSVYPGKAEFNLDIFDVRIQPATRQVFEVYANFKRTRDFAKSGLPMNFVLTEVVATDQGGNLPIKFFTPDLDSTIQIKNSDALNQFDASSTFLNINDASSLQVGQVLISKETSEQVLIINIISRNEIEVLRGINNSTSSKDSVKDTAEFIPAQSIKSNTFILYDTSIDTHLGSTEIYGPQGIPTGIEDVYDFVIEAKKNDFDDDKQEVVIDEITLSVEGTSNVEDFVLYNKVTGRELSKGLGLHDGRLVSKVYFDLKDLPLNMRTVPEGEFIQFLVRARVSIEFDKPASLSVYIDSLGDVQSTFSVNPSAIVWKDKVSSLSTEASSSFWIDGSAEKLKPSVITYNDSANKIEGDTALRDFIGTFEQPAKLKGKVSFDMKSTYKRGEHVEIKLTNYSDDNFVLYGKDSCAKYFSVKDRFGQTLRISSSHQTCQQAIVTKIIPVRKETTLSIWDQNHYPVCETEQECFSQSVNAGTYTIHVNDISHTFEITGDTFKSYANEFPDLNVGDAVSLLDIPNLSIKLVAIGEPSVGTKHTATLLLSKDGQNQQIKLVPSGKKEVFGATIYFQGIKNAKARFRVEPLIISLTDLSQNVTDIIFPLDKLKQNEILNLVEDLPEDRKEQLASFINNHRRDISSLLVTLPDVKYEHRDELLKNKLSINASLDRFSKTIQTLKEIQIPASELGTIIDTINFIREYNFTNDGEDRMQEKIGYATSRLTDKDLSAEVVLGLVTSLKAEAKEVMSKERESKYKKRLIPFKDIDDNHWSFSFTKFLFDNNISNGYSGIREGEYGPSDNVTRAEIIKLALGAANIEVAEENPSRVDYDDIDTSRWYARYIKRGRDLGIIGGENNKFHPDNPVTRAEALKIILNAFNVKPASVEISSFRDVTIDWHKRFIEYAKEHNIVSGYNDGTFNPDGHITRAEMAKIIMNAINHLNK